MSAMGGTKSAAAAASHGKSTHVSWLTSVTKLSTSARPARRAEHFADDLRGFAGVYEVVNDEPRFVYAREVRAL